MYNQLLLLNSLAPFCSVTRMHIDVHYKKASLHACGTLVSIVFKDDVIIDVPLNRFLMLHHSKQEQILENKNDVSSKELSEPTLKKVRGRSKT